MNHRQVAHFPCSLCLFSLKPSSNQLLNPISGKNRDSIVDLLLCCLFQLFLAQISDVWNEGTFSHRRQLACVCVVIVGFCCCCYFGFVLF